MVMSELPLPLFASAGSLNTQPLQKVFKRTTAAYKFLWFLAILDVVKESDPSTAGNLIFSTQDICARMVAKSWIPTQRFKLSFGCWDSMTKVIEALKNPVNGFPFSVKYREPEALKALEAFAKVNPKNFQKIIFNPLIQEVSFRFLNAWRSKSAEGLKESIRGATSGEPYSFPNGNWNSIEVPSQWAAFFRKNYSLLKDFTYWNFADFLQARNTAVPGLVKKFELPASRLSLDSQRKFWLSYLNSEQVTTDIYGHEFTADSFALDHFLPWTFVVHNQIWNLTPMEKSLNSSKSDLIPDEAFVAPLARQHQSLVKYHYRTDPNKSKDFFEEYENFFGISIADFVSASDTFVIDKYKEHVDPLAKTAINMGFQLWQ